MKSRKNMLRFGLVLIALIIFLCWFMHEENTKISITEFEIFFPELPHEFDSYRIVHLSDFHSGSFGPELNQVLAKLRTISADCIVFTGDMFDSRRLSLLSQGMVLVEGLVELAPVYYVVGNHEGATGQWPILQEKIQNYGVEILHNRVVQIHRGDQAIYLLGLDDPSFLRYRGLTAETSLENMVKGISENFLILLSHRPELMSVYTKKRIDLVLTGHAHGGQVRLPWVGGLIAPQQGFFPKYSEGIYTEDQTMMVVNRGLGNSVIPQRIFNRPEIIVITLHKK